MDIDFRRRPAGDSQNRRSASPHQRPDPPVGGTGGDPPERRTHTRSPDTDIGTPSRTSLQSLKEYATTCARQNRLSAVAEEGIIEFAQVSSCAHCPVLHDLTRLVSLIKRNNSFTSVRRWPASSNGSASLKPTPLPYNPNPIFQQSPNKSWCAPSA